MHRHRNRRRQERDRQAGRSRQCQQRWPGARILLQTRPAINPGYRQEQRRDQIRREHRTRPLRPEFQDGGEEGTVQPAIGELITLDHLGDIPQQVLFRDQECRAVHHMGGMEAFEQDEKPGREEGHSQELGSIGQASGYDAGNQELGAA